MRQRRGRQPCSWPSNQEPPDHTTGHRPGYGPTVLRLVWQWLPLRSRSMRQSVLIITIVTAIVAILFAVLVRFATLTPFIEMTVRRVEFTEKRLSYAFAYRVSANIETCDVIYRNGVAKEGWSSGPRSSNFFVAAIHNLRDRRGSSSMSLLLPDVHDVVLSIAVGDVRRLGVGDELLLAEYRDGDGTVVKHAIRIYAVDYDGKRLPVP